MPYFPQNVYIYSNDGSTQLTYFDAGYVSVAVTETGTDRSYTYSGDKTFIGFATTPNATTPDYAVGDSFTVSGTELTLYIVEGGNSNTVVGGATITDLTNTTWYIPAGWAATAGYGQFSIDCYEPEYPTNVGNTFVVGYRVRSGEYVSYADKAGACNISTGYWGIYGPDSEFTVTITGGEDVTHTALISWLETYGELQGGEEATAATITYNGNVLATLPDGQTATLPCEGKKMVGDIVIAYGGEEETGLITFKVVEAYETQEIVREYIRQAEPGMTWEEWCESEYNPDGTNVSTFVNFQALNGGFMTITYKDKSYVKPSDVITANAIYYYYVSSHGGGSYD